MAWFADLAGRAENLLNNLDEQTASALRNHNGKKPKHDKNIFSQHDSNNWNQRTRHPLRSPKKPVAVTEAKSSPVRKLSPLNYPHSHIKENHAERQGLRLKKSPVKIKNTQYTLENCPKTLVDEVKGDSEIADSQKKRRFSLPSDPAQFDSELMMHSQNLQMENLMLKNEVINLEAEVQKMLAKVQTADDDLAEKQQKLEDCELQNHKLVLDNETLSSQLKLLKEKIQEIAKLEQLQHDEKLRITTENFSLKENNRYLEERINVLTKTVDEANSTQQRLETELRHAQSSISELKSNLAKSNGECQRLEKDWETYKLRVKSMLFLKDSELKALQEGLTLSEDNKVLVEQLKSLKKERDELSEAITNIRNECDSMKQSLSIVESRNKAGDRVVAALRDALKEERSIRNRAETQLFAISKELKSMQNETGQTIASLRTALRDKEAELTHIRETSLRNVDPSALNVADYDVTQDSIETEKIQYLTETLVQRQAKVEKLLAENNMLRIQLDKLESKFKTELANRSNNNHSIVNFQSGDHRTKRVQSDLFVASLSNRIAAVMRRNPMIRIFVIIYMICLHFWVLTVLLTSTPPENFIPKK